MCCGYGGGFDPGAYIIADLKKGDEIILEPGCGDPKSEEKRTLVILVREGYSALCTDGTRLACSDGGNITKTGRTLKANASLKAVLILLRVAINKIPNRFYTLRLNIDSKIWDLKRWFRHRLDKAN